MNINKLMRQLNAKKIEAREVVIKGDEGEIIIQNPEVLEMSVMGKKVFQIAGEIKRFKEEDVKLVMEKTGKSREEVMKALTETKGDLAEAILRLEE